MGRYFLQNKNSRRVSLNSLRRLRVDISALESEVSIPQKFTTRRNTPAEFLHFVLKSFSVSTSLFETLHVLLKLTARSARYRLTMSREDRKTIVSKLFPASCGGSQEHSARSCILVGVGDSERATYLPWARQGVFMAPGPRGTPRRADELPGSLFDGISRFLRHHHRFLPSALRSGATLTASGCAPVCRWRQARRIH